jgi:hypothetical protein
MKFLLAIAVTTLGFVEACSTVPHDLVAAQQLQYLRRDILHVGFDKLHVDFVYQEINRSSVPFDSVLIDYNLSFDGHRASSSEGLKYSFISDGSSVFSIPVQVRYSDLLKTVPALGEAMKAGRRTIQFQMTIVATFHLRRSSFHLDLKSEGELPLPSIIQYYPPIEL